jgi:hypothetical protein
MDRSAVYRGTKTRLKDAVTCVFVERSQLAASILTEAAAPRAQTFVV